MSAGHHKGTRPITVIELARSPGGARGVQEEIDLRLHEAVKQNDITRLKELVNGQEIEVNALDSEGNTALHVAAENNNPLAVWHLMRLGANSRIRNGEGKTAGDIASKKILIK